MIIKQFFTQNGMVERPLKANEISEELRNEYLKDKQINDNLPSLNIVQTAIEKAFEEKQANIIFKIVQVIYSISKRQD